MKKDKKKYFYIGSFAISLKTDHIFIYNRVTDLVTAGAYSYPACNKYKRAFEGVKSLFAE